MDKNIALKAENLSKTYFNRSNEWKVWRSEIQIKPALKNINFEIEKGEMISLNGGNGAGKSTLLKILSRITSPTTGKIQGTGKVNSLLEIGAGFYPELSGLENIYLNGAMLGMNKTEIKENIEHIHEFSGLGESLFISVKNYSSGMYMRLAFATATHLASDILIFDEILSVADLKFQLLALNKIKQINQQGKTIIMVSHNNLHSEKLKTRNITLKDGEIIQ